MKPDSVLLREMERITTFSPLLVGVLSETEISPHACKTASVLSVPYWSGCSVKHIAARTAEISGVTFSPLLVRVLSETKIAMPRKSIALFLSVPYWSGCSVKHGEVVHIKDIFTTFQSPTGRGAQ